jgi:hypothetical protein
MVSEFEEYVMFLISLLENYPHTLRVGVLTPVDIPTILHPQMLRV